MVHAGGSSNVGVLGTELSSPANIRRKKSRCLHTLNVSPQLHHRVLPQV